MNTLILAMVLSACAFSAGCSRERFEGHSPSNEWLSQLRSVNKLILARMSIRKMATIDDMKLDQAKGARQTFNAIVDAMKLGSRKGAYSYTTYLQAYIDLSELTPEDIRVDEDTKTVEIRLPEIRTEFIGRDAELREEHYRVTGLRSLIDARERADLKEAMNTRLRQEVEEKSTFRDQLKTTAREKAAAYFESLAQTQGYIAVLL